MSKNDIIICDKMAVFRSKTISGDPEFPKILKEARAEVRSIEAATCPDLPVLRREGSGIGVANSREVRFSESAELVRQASEMSSNGNNEEAINTMITALNTLPEVSYKDRQARERVANKLIDEIEESAKHAKKMGDHGRSADLYLQAIGYSLSYNGNYHTTKKLTRRARKQAEKAYELFGDGEKYEHWYHRLKEVHPHFNI